MASTEWNSSLALGIERIDEQHRRLIEMVSEFKRAVGAGKAGGALRELLEKLNNYAQIHFDTEEGLLRGCRCPELEQQEAEHEQFFVKVCEFKDKLELGRLNLHVEVAEFLTTWLTNHIDQEDRKYVEFVKGGRLG